jgi:uncharacterized membrane protein
VLALAGLFGTATTSAAQEAVVHAVLFYSPVCPHCEKVIAEDLPPLTAKYGSKLDIAAVDVTKEQGRALYLAAVDYFHLTEPRLGVPTLVVGTEVMVGEVEIPARFPGLVADGLAAGGTGWPPVPQVRQALAAQGILRGQPSADEATAAASATPAGRGSTTQPGGTAPHDPAAADSARAPSSTGDHPTGIGALADSMARKSPWERFRLDPVANGIAVLVLLGMLGVLAAAVRAVAVRAPSALSLPTQAIPVLGTIGLAVASYLTVVEVTGSQAVCGPVGDCNAVQQSAYAIFLGVPVGVWGVAGYVAMLGAWACAVVGPRRFVDSAWLVLWVMVLGGVAFSIYLTFLEPFVIGATCAWCLTSAVVLTLMLLGATPHVAARRG